MGKENTTGILILLVIVAIGLFGGIKPPSVAGPDTTTNTTSEPTTASNDQKIQDTQQQISALQKQIQAQEDEKTYSQYRGKVTLSYVNRSTDPNQEYITIKVNYNATGTIPVTGWVLKSEFGGTQMTIPKGTYLFFTGMLNVEDNILLTADDTLYLVTGISPNGASFKVNKCSGYLGQFQTFVPYLSTNCPLPKDEDLSSIPKLAINSDCFDYIDNFPRCRIQTDPVPQNWSTECMNFIYNKINYPSCVNTHKNDNDFYQKEWRVYLKRTDRIWVGNHETITLYDNVGKIVDTTSY